MFGQGRRTERPTNHARKSASKLFDGCLLLGRPLGIWPGAGPDLSQRTARRPMLGCYARVMVRHERSGDTHGQPSPDEAPLLAIVDDFDHFIAGDQHAIDDVLATMSRTR